VTGPLSTSSSRRRPAFWTAISFAAGIVAAAVCTIPPTFLYTATAVVCLTATAILLSRPQQVRLACSVMLILAAVLGALRYQVETALLPVNHISSMPELLGESGPGSAKGRLSGIVDGEPDERADHAKLVIRLHTFESEQGETYQIAGTALVSMRNAAISIDHADEVTLQGRLARPQPARNPGAFDYRRFLELRGIHGVLSVRRAEQIISVRKRSGGVLHEWVVSPVRQTVRRVIGRNLSGEPAGLLRGILLGEKQAISERLRDDFRTTGLAHALVISGLHVGLVALFFFSGFRLCRLSDSAASLATVGVLTTFAFVTELQAPVVRASIMAAVVLTGRAINRDGEVFNSTGLAALVILVIWPTSLLTLSFQLSFAATLSIVALHETTMQLFPERWRSEGRALGKWVISPLCVSLAAQAGTAPLIAYHFHQLAPLSLAANLVVVPLLGLVVGLGLLAALTGAWSVVAGTLFNGANYLVITCLTELVGIFANIPGASVATPRPGIGIMIAAAVATVLLTQARDHVWARKLLIGLLLIGANIVVWRGTTDEGVLKVFYLDVGQGDGAFLQFPNGATMLVDAGNRSKYFDYGSRVIVPFLRTHNVGKIDVVVAGDSLLGLGGVGALILHPTAEFVDEEGTSAHGLNNGSTVLRLDYGGTSLLFTGDAEVETDAPILRWGKRLRADILKVAHHGSPTSSRQSFVGHLRPETAVISVGAVNNFGHPSAEELERFREQGTVLYRTDRCGAVMAQIDVSGQTTWQTMLGNYSAPVGTAVSAVS